MPRALSLIAAAALLAVACTGLPTAPPSAAPTVDIKRSKLDISYSVFVDNDVHNVSSKKALTMALDAIRAEVKATNGKDDVATPDFQDVTEPVNADFKKFADAVSALAAKNPQLSSDRIADAAIGGMIKASPDCHTAYVNKQGRVFRSRDETTRGTPAQIPAGGVTVVAGDQAGLVAKALPGGIGYVTFNEFVRNGTYDISTQVNKALDLLLAQGAKAWLFDLRGNRGGDPPQLMTSWFLNGESTIKIELRNGFGGTQDAKRDLRLPAAYQLPVAIILNDTGGSSPEVFSLGLKENKRATIVGQKSTGCLGATAQTAMSDGSEIDVVIQEFVGAQTGAKYNNVGIPPDVPADDSSAVGVATKTLQDQIARKG